MDYNERALWLKAQCEAAIPEVDWGVMSKFDMMLRGDRDEEYPVFRVYAWAHRADGKESGRAIGISIEFMGWDEKGAVEMALKAGRMLAAFAKEES